jgi:hypothetical protein
VFHLRRSFVAPLLHLRGRRLSVSSRPWAPPPPDDPGRRNRAGRTCRRRRRRRPARPSNAPTTMRRAPASSWCSRPALAASPFTGPASGPARTGRPSQIHQAIPHPGWAPSGGLATGAPGLEKPDEPSDQEQHGVTSLPKRESSDFPLEPADTDDGEHDDVAGGGQQ